MMVDKSFLVVLGVWGGLIAGVGDALTARLQIVRFDGAGVEMKGVVVSSSIGRIPESS